MIFVAPCSLGRRCSDELENRKLTEEAKKGDEAQKVITLSAKSPWVAATGSWLDDAEQHEDRLDYGALEPSETDRWTFIACVPEDATMVLAYSELFYDEKGLWPFLKRKLYGLLAGLGLEPHEPESQDSKKVVKVPESESVNQRIE